MAKLKLFTGAIQKEWKEVKTEFLGEAKEESPLSLEEKAEKKKEQKRLKEEARYQKEKSKKREEQEYKREKVREAMRQKYGIAKKPSTSQPDTAAAIQEVKSTYNMSEDEFKDFEKRVEEERRQKEETRAKIDKRLDTRRKKKELKENIKNGCNAQ